MRVLLSPVLAPISYVFSVHRPLFASITRKVTGFGGSSGRYLILKFASISQHSLSTFSGIRGAMSIKNVVVVVAMEGEKCKR